MKQKLIYIASPYSHKSKSVMKNRVATVSKVAAILTKKYKFAMFLPITQSAEMVKYEPSLGGDFKSWESIDIFMVKEKADEVWVILMEGYDTSIGVTAEIECARRHNKPIKYFNTQGICIWIENKFKNKRKVAC